MKGAAMTPTEFVEMTGLKKSEAHSLHVQVIKAAMQKRQQLNVEAVTAYGVPLPACYVRAGHKYVIAKTLI